MDGSFAGISGVSIRFQPQPNLNPAGHGLLALTGRTETDGQKAAQQDIRRVFRQIGLHNPHPVHAALSIDQDLQHRFGGEGLARRQGQAGVNIGQRMGLLGQGRTRQVGGQAGGCAKFVGGRRRVLQGIRDGCRRVGRGREGGQGWENLRCGWPCAMRCKTNFKRRGRPVPDGSELPDQG